MAASGHDPQGTPHPAPEVGAGNELERSWDRLEAPAGFEPAVKLLQSSALPLGHGARLPE